MVLLVRSYTGPSFTLYFTLHTPLYFDIDFGGGGVGIPPDFTLGDSDISC